MSYTEAIQAFLDDLERRARIGAGAATEFGLGLLLGIYACRDEDDNDRVLTHTGMPDAVDNLASRVLSEMVKCGLEQPDDWLARSAPPGGGIPATALTAQPSSPARPIAA
ncbi:MAG: hypothetical protein L0K86_25355 [Actinomycetia bacterium]|nr:hypothetical protein [Actinomycetes bacterium]